MPHSSGGGHHGGGHHGGHGGGHSIGGHSSGSHRGFSRDTGRSGTGLSSYHYSYRNHGHVYHYIGEDYFSFQSVLLKYIFIALIILLVFVVLLVQVISAILPVKKLKGTENNQNYIEDVQNILGDTANLEQSLQAFREKSGIAVVIVAVPRYMDNQSLETYAYSLYTQKCTDETFWLIAYSAEPDNTMTSDWSFEGIQGDCTDEILTYDLTWSFNSSLTYKLDHPSASPAEAFQKAFDELTPKLLQNKSGSGYVENYTKCLIILGLILCFPAYKIYQMAGVSASDFYRIDSLSTLSGTESSTPSDTSDPPPPSSDRQYKICPHCDAIYFENDNNVCPYCGKKQIR